MNAYAASPAPTPRRPVYQRAAPRSETPPFHYPRRTNKPGHTVGSRFSTPIRAASRRLSVGKDDVSDISGANLSMDVDEEETIERGLKYETIFAKLEELQVTFYALLPGEVKLILRNAGTRGLLLPEEVYVFIVMLLARLLQRCVYR